MSPRWQKIYQEKKASAEVALGKVRRGAKVFIGTACGEPQHLVRALIEKTDSLHDVQLLHFVTLGNAPYIDKRFDTRFRHNAFFVGPNTRDAINEARADYTPVFISEIPKLFRTRTIELDVALIQTSPPDEHGFVSLGISVDIVKAAVDSAKTVIAQVNRYMPRTMGETFIPLDDVDIIVEHDEPIIEFRYPEADEIGHKIASNVAKLIHDGDTLHIGYGHIPYAVLSHVRDKRHIGIHTEVISDAFIDLIENNIVTGSRKTLHTGRVVCSFCIGSRKIYDYVHDNPRVLFFPAEHVYNPLVIAQNERMVSIGSALEVDLSGQICSESKAFHFYSGIGGRLDFIRGAAMSKRGKSIIALPSTTRDGKRSRIRAHLEEGAGVVATRGDVQYVVTEYGIAYLHGKSIRERAMALINIAHPMFRKQLLDEAKKHAYVYPDQIFIHTQYHAYPEEEESREALKDGTPVTIRPIKPTDEPLLQDFFYSHSDETVYRRYFRSVRSMPHSKAQTLVNLDYKDNMAFVATIGEIGFEKIIGVARYAKEKDHPGMVEVAYTIREDYHRLGLGSILQDRLEHYAKKMGFKGVAGYLFEDNVAMLRTFARKGRYKGDVVSDGVIRVWRVFEEGVGRRETRGRRMVSSPN
ncbi:MAG: GNAT family N-acetyltransferase [Deltaproteobacteria bacterium]|nr:GNAT family N-acetyltransferase [Deltaproteobacteria bacterium]MBW2082947.1 GNAT family N-acetyltransferase [Deltaproteobacteria bacterium]